MGANVSLVRVAAGALSAPQSLWIVVGIGVVVAWALPSRSRAWLLVLGIAVALFLLPIAPKGSLGVLFVTFLRMLGGESRKRTTGGGAKAAESGDGKRPCGSTDASAR